MTTSIAFLRHGPTAWNAARRLQGMRDVPLSVEGRAEVARWVLPPGLLGWRWMTSPLGRAVETARLLGAADAAPEPLLREMSFGAWEGLTLEEVRARDGAAAEMEARGVDFRPPGGESPREVMVRLGELFVRIAADGKPTVAVTHKGVIRALLALATGWTMLGKPPARLDWRSVHLFQLDAAGRPRVERLNIALDGAGAPGRREARA